MIDLRQLGTITSGYGARKSPTKGASTFHKGLDIVLKNEAIPSVMDGTVSKVGKSSSAGNWISIKQTDGTTATYMHLAEMPSWSVGDTIAEGQTVGIMGNTGISTGRHLHIQFSDNRGNTLDPVAYFETGDGTNTDWKLDEIEANSSWWSGLLEKIVFIVAILCVAVLGAVLFMQAFKS